MSEDDIIKERILTTCQERFFKEGFAATSVDEISTDLAMSKKTFYKYFSSKDDLVRQIMHRFMGRMRVKSEEILLENSSAVEKLSAFITLLGTNASRLTPLYGKDIKKHIPQLWKEIEEFRQERISWMFARLTKQGMDEGTVRPDMNPRVFLMSILGTIERIMQPDVLIHESFSVSDALAEILNIFFRGGLTQKGREQFEDLHHA